MKCLVKKCREMRNFAKMNEVKIRKKSKTLQKFRILQFFREDFRRNHVFLYFVFLDDFSAKILHLFLIQNFFAKFSHFFAKKIKANEMQKNAKIFCIFAKRFFLFAANPSLTTEYNFTCYKSINIKWFKILIILYIYKMHS